MNTGINWSLLKQPISDIEDIPWKHFGYSFVIIFTLPFVLPIFLIGLMYTDIISESDVEITAVYWTAIQYAITFALFLFVPVILISVSLSFFIFGYTIEGSILVLTSILWLIGYSLIFPGVLVLISHYEGPMAWRHLPDIKKAVDNDPGNYREAVTTIMLSSILFLIVSALLLWTLIGTIAVPLLLLWFVYLASLVQRQVQPQFEENYIDSTE